MAKINAVEVDSEGIPIYKMTPSEELDYSISYSDWLATSDTISDSTWLYTGLELGGGQTSFTTTKSTIWVKAENATVGTTYRVINYVTTTIGPRKVNKEFKIKVVERRF